MIWKNKPCPHWRTMKGLLIGLVRFLAERVAAKLARQYVTRNSGWKMFPLLWSGPVVEVYAMEWPCSGSVRFKVHLLAGHTHTHTHAVRTQLAFKYGCIPRMSLCHDKSPSIHVISQRNCVGVTTGVIIMALNWWGHTPKHS